MVNGLKEFISGLMLSNIFTSNLDKRKQRKLNMSESEKKKGDAVDRLEGKAVARRNLRRLQEQSLRSCRGSAQGSAVACKDQGRRGWPLIRWQLCREGPGGSWWAAK